MTFKHTSDGFAVVDTDIEMIDATIRKPPNKGVFLCGNIHTGKTVISPWNPDFKFTHWYPLPVFPKPVNK